MSPTHTRRRLLQSVGAGVVAGLTGCIRAGGPERETTYVRPQGDGDEPTDGPGGNESTPADRATPARSKTYGFEVTNEMTVEAFEASEAVAGPQQAALRLRVTDIDPEDETAYFEQTIEVGIGETKTFPEAFTVTGTRRIYEISVMLEPFVDGGISKQANREDDFVFTAWSDKMPSKNPILVVVGSGDREETALYPFVVLDPLEGNACDRRDFCSLR